MKWETNWKTIWDTVGDKAGNKVEEKVEDKREENVGDKAGDRVEGKVGDKVGDTMRDTVGDEVGDTVGGKMGDKCGNVGDKFPRFLEPCAHIPQENGTRYHPLLLDIETQQFSAVGKNGLMLWRTNESDRCDFVLRKHCKQRQTMRLIHT